MNAQPQPSLRGQYAGFITRAIAFFIDLAIINIVVAVATTAAVLFMRYFNYAHLFFAAGTDEPTTLGVVISSLITLGTTLGMYFGYVVLFWVISGQTLGKRLMGLRIAQMDGSPMTFRRGTVRLIGYWISAIPFLLGYFWVLIDNQRRAWHDKMAGTCVIYSWDASIGPLLRERERRHAAKLNQAQAAKKDRTAKA